MRRKISINSQNNENFEPSSTTNDEIQDVINELENNILILNDRIQGLIQKLHTEEGKGYSKQIQNQILQMLRRKKMIQQQLLRNQMFQNKFQNLPKFSTNEDDIETVQAMTLPSNSNSHAISTLKVIGKNEKRFDFSGLGNNINLIHSILHGASYEFHDENLDDKFYELETIYLSHKIIQQ